MTGTDILAVLVCARQFYVQDHQPIVEVFNLATSNLNAPDEVKFEAIRRFVSAMPDPGRIMRIEEMLVTDLIATFDAAIKKLQLDAV